MLGVDSLFVADFFRFEVLTAVKMSFFWVVKPYGLALQP
jgi:hypothetical protein